MIWLIFLELNDIFKPSTYPKDLNHSPATLSTAIFWIRMKTYSMESPQAFLDASTLLGNPLMGSLSIWNSNPPKNITKESHHIYANFHDWWEYGDHQFQWASFEIWAGNNLTKKLFSENILPSTSSWGPPKHTTTGLLGLLGEQSTLSQGPQSGPSGTLTQRTFILLSQQMPRI